jgi:hypothetical protein
MVAEVNKRRAAGWTGALANGTASTLPPVGPLLADPDLFKAAVASVTDSAQTRTSVHKDWITPNVGTRTHTASGEVIGEDKGFPETTTYFVDAWMKSDGHRAILMNGRYDSAGFAYSRLGDDQVYFAGEFADFSAIPTPPRRSTPVPTPRRLPVAPDQQPDRQGRRQFGSDRERHDPRRHGQRPVRHRDHGPQRHGHDHDPQRRPRGPHRRDLSLQLLGHAAHRGRPQPEHRRRDDRLRALQPHPARRVLVLGAIRNNRFLGGRTEDMLSTWHSGGKGSARSSSSRGTTSRASSRIRRRPVRGPAARAPGSSSATVRARPTTATSSSATTPS